MALPQQFLPTISAEQYLNFERCSEERHEFIDGVVYAMAGYHREADGTWGEVEITDADDSLILNSIECRVAVADIYRNTEVEKQTNKKSP